jgi:ribonucleoside-diphosphate reductase alpha chain
MSRAAEDGNWPQAAASDTSLFRTATSIDVQDHLRVAGAAAALVDDGVSKTVNLPPSATREDVSAIFMDAWTAGLKAISVYRDMYRA